jgi:hypothetical protein
LKPVFIRLRDVVHVLGVCRTRVYELRDERLKHAPLVPPLLPDDERRLARQRVAERAAEERARAKMPKGEYREWNHGDRAVTSDFDAIREAVFRISPDCPQDAWWRVAAALFNEFGDDAFDLFDEWSTAVRALSHLFDSSCGTN